ncbi:rap1 GTPase-GDP dissociation stimulator 1-like [Ornithodoros turicata]|uniref:rap1 GTPase-GDP dissociation stimulator 1-like n=1 Tax=Ornithodoros turicata TaxID=34597 RepID=UPI00313A1855
MDEVTRLLSECKLSTHEGKQLDSTALQNSLKKLVALLTAEGTTSKDQKQVADQLVKGGFVDIVKNTSKRISEIHVDCLSVFAQAVAEACKNDVLRKLCTDVTIIEPLLKQLSRVDYAAVQQVCRALGNICYDNDVARDIVKSHHGVEQLLQLLQNLLEADTVPDNLHTVASGCLLNLTDMQEIQEQALQLGLVDILLKYLNKFGNDEEVAMHCVLVLNSIADTDSGRKHLLKPNIFSSLLALLDKNFLEDGTEILLELFGNLAESDAVKESLAQDGFCEKLVNMLQRFQAGPASEDKQGIMKTICDLIILVLTGDASMRHVYQNGSGSVYKATIGWLQSEDDNLKVAGALAAGNFARKDDHCIQMVQDGVAVHLLNLLQDQTGSDGDIRLQHALLAALRNLALPVANKPILVELGIVDKLLSMLGVETFPVVFKLLGTLRMLVCKQEAVATKLGLNEKLVQHLVSWCSTEDHPGVKGESVRLLAWIVKNSSSTEVKAALCRGGALVHLVAMLASEHAVMQSEGLLALALIASSPPDIAVEEFKKTDVVQLLHNLLKTEGIASECLQNGLAVTTALGNLGPFKPLLLEEGYVDTLKNMKRSPDVLISKAAQTALEVLEKV